MKELRLLLLRCSLVLVAITSVVFAQTAPEVPMSSSLRKENAEEVARILGIAEIVSNARLMHSTVSCGTTPTLEELSMRQDILETVVAASFDADGVLAELDSERARLSELSSLLQSRRDHTVNLLNVANLITGTGVGIGVNALQFSSSAASFGNGLGVGSGIGSTVLSIIGIRRQHGPISQVGRVPNMLAPLFEREAKLNSYYPPIVMEYLHSAPAGASKASGSRLDQLMAEWRVAGRIAKTNSPEAEKKIMLLTASSDEKAKLSIDDLSDRIAMLSDVSGRVALMKRDLAELMTSIRAGQSCR